MPNVYPLDPNFGGGSGKTAGIPGIPNLDTSTGTVAPIIPAEKIIQSYKNRFVSQDQIDKWDSVYKAIEQNNGINYRWYQTVTINQQILDNSNLVTLPNNKCFYDLDSKSLMVFVNDNYVAPSKYIITNKRQFYFKNGVVALNDVVHIVHLNKENQISNYDTTLMAIATTWQYTYTNDTGNSITKITLDNKHSFLNPDKYSVLVYIDGKYIPTSMYSIDNTRDLTFDGALVTLDNGSTLTIIQLGQVLPNEEYVGFLWGETINSSATGGMTFTISKGHAFTNLHDKSSLVFLNGKITKKYTILNTNTIKFDHDVGPNADIEIIQLGFTTDLTRIKELLNLNNLNSLTFDESLYVKKADRNVPNGVAGIELDGFIDNKYINLNDAFMDRIKAALTASGWTPGGGGGSGGSTNVNVWRHEGELTAPNLSVIQLPADKVVTANKNDYIIFIFGSCISTTDYDLDVPNNSIKIANPFYQQAGMKYNIWHISTN